MSLLLILLDGLEFLGTPLFDSKDFFKLIVKSSFYLSIFLIIVRYIYYPITKNKDYLFTYFLISLTVFLLCILLDSVKIELAFALGLFAIFGIIRYRTDPIPIKEMTYLFLVIGVSVVNALSTKLNVKIKRDSQEYEINFSGSANTFFFRSAEVCSKFIKPLGLK